MRCAAVGKPLARQVASRGRGLVTVAVAPARTLVLGRALAGIRPIQAIIYPHSAPCLGAGPMGGSVAATRGLHMSAALRMAEVVMNVPSMGDSITEGTLQSWAKKVGEAVAVDDVVAVIETDKVSVEIRAKDAGVLVETYANADETVAVGAKLLKIDTAGTPSASASAPASAPAVASPGASAFTAADTAHLSTTAASTPESGGEHGARKPSIKFIGKRGLLNTTAVAGHQQRAPVSAVGGKAPPPSVRYEDLKSTPGAKTFADMPPMYGRPPLSQAEIDAIESGGAI